MEKTIAAISTGMVPSGISIVRMSGPEALDIADKVYHKKNMRPEDTGKKPLFHKMKSHTIHYGYIFDGENDIDEVLVSVMKAPHTFTGEDTIEINCHGGMLVAKKVLELLLRKGASAAEPGEFTKRAFLNGRMDLSRAEAVIDVIDAKNEFALKASLSQLKGSVSEKVRKLRDEILDEMSFIEAALDDPEHYDLDGFGDELKEKLMPVQAEIKEMIRRADYGSVMAEGVKTVIAGKPNAGKSSLLNILAGYEKAIVTDVAGTTRDVLEVPILLKNISLILMDTAGIRNTEDTVEKIGVDRAKDALNQADLVLYVIDSTASVDEEEMNVIRSIPENAKVIFVLNKTDLAGEKADVGEIKRKIGHLLNNNSYDSKEIKMTGDESSSEKESNDSDKNIILFSAETKEGLTELEDAITSLYNAEELTYNDQVVITNARQKALLFETEDALSMVIFGIDDGMSEEFLVVDLMNAYTALGKIIGEEVGDDVVSRVFEKFCMGK